MNVVTAAEHMADLARVCVGQDTPDAVLASALPMLVELTGARSVQVTRTQGEGQVVVMREGAVIDSDATVGTRTVTRRLPGDAGVVVVAWDRERPTAYLTWLDVALTLVAERVARLQAEDRLSDLTVRVDNAQQLANMGDYDWHIASDTNMWSDQLYRIYGHEPQSFNPSYERFLAHLHPEDRERITAIHQQAYASGEPYEMVERVIRPDGGVRYLSSNGQVLRDATGTPARMRGTCIDITDRVLAEQARERIAARFRGMVESSPDAILILDAQGRIVQGNRRAHDLLGGDPMAAGIDEIAHGLRAEGHGVEAVGLDGRPLELDVTTAELTDVDGETLVAVYLRDASVRLADESRAAALREAQVRHRQALEINDDVVQGLTVAVLAMQQGDLAASTSYLEETLSAARRLMNDWSGGPHDQPLRPGCFVRTLASTLQSPQADARVCDSSVALAPVPTPTHKILVVDDSNDVRALLCAQLRSTGRYEIVGQAADGEEAVRLAASLQPHLVLLDLSMPQMDGLQALPLILDVVAGVRVIVMSGFDQRSVADQVLAAGAVRYIEKGLRMDVVRVIDEVLDAA